MIQGVELACSSVVCSRQGEALQLRLTSSAEAASQTGPDGNGSKCAIFHQACSCAGPKRQTDLHRFRAVSPSFTSVRASS